MSKLPIQVLEEVKTQDDKNASGVLPKAIWHGYKL